MTAVAPISLRLPPSLLARVDAEVSRLAKEPDAAAQRPTRATVIRRALQAGLPPKEKR